MVVKRQCSFCAGEIEPGTGFMFVKRDGTVFYFCCSSCRKQQLVLGRVGHRLKWTRAHTLKRAQTASVAASPAGRRGPSRAGNRRLTGTAPSAAVPPRPAAAGTVAEEVPAPSEAEPTPVPKSESPPPKKTRTRKPKPTARSEPDASPSDT
ncbi:MAG: 50S ribosomal protein L24e [Thermoplasmata archaeon]